MYNKTLPKQVQS